MYAAESRVRLANKEQNRTEGADSSVQTEHAQQALSGCQRIFYNLTASEVLRTAFNLGLRDHPLLLLLDGKEQQAGRPGSSSFPISSRDHLILFASLNSRFHHVHCERTVPQPLLWQHSRLDHNTGRPLPSTTQPKLEASPPHRHQTTQTNALSNCRPLLPCLQQHTHPTTTNDN